MRKRLECQQDNMRIMDNEDDFKDRISSVILQIRYLINEIESRTQYKYKRDAKPKTQEFADNLWERYYRLMDFDKNQ